jgi:Ring finger domain
MRENTNSARRTSAAGEPGEDNVWWCTLCDDAFTVDGTSSSHMCAVCCTELEFRQSNVIEGALQVQEQVRIASQQLRVTHNEILASIRRQREDLTTEQTRLLREIRTLRDMVAETRAHIRSVHSQALAVAAAGATGNTAWEEIPPELLNPLTAVSPDVDRPVAKKILEEFPRTVLTEQSVLFHDATISIWTQSSSEAQGSANTTTTETVIPGEFGPKIDPLGWSAGDVPLLVASPLTGKDNGQLDEACIRLLQRCAENSQYLRPQPCIMYLERGDGITFVRKAANVVRVVQELTNNQLQVAAVVIGNDKPQPWPYVMRDSTNEAAKYNLKIPVVMVSQQTGRLIKQSHEASRNEPIHPPYQLRCTLTINNNSKRDCCVICCDEYAPDHTIVRIPYCGHVFHESCALPWFQRHNTCPTCRRLLPTDDAEFNEEQQRRQSEQPSRGHRASTDERGTTANGSQGNSWNDFYG